MVKYLEIYEEKVSPFFGRDGRDETGYGDKILTDRKIRLPGQKSWRRVYSTYQSNVPSFWVMVGEEKYFLRGLMEVNKHKTMV